MPKDPDKYSSKKKYMRECVEQLKKEGKSGKEARKQCFAVWASNKNS